jgi:hypothetical protein
VDLTRLIDLVGVALLMELRWERDTRSDSRSWRPVVGIEARRDEGQLLI